jgi:hypothetical protein
MIAGISSKKTGSIQQKLFFINARIRKRLNQFDFELHKKKFYHQISYIKITMKKYCANAHTRGFGSIPVCRIQYAYFI